MTGACTEGEKRTQDTHSVWPSSEIVYLHSPSVFHNLTVLSLAPDTIWRLSVEKATLKTSFEWPTKRRVVLPVASSQSRSVPSHDPLRANWPSEEMTTSDTKWLWPLSARRG